MSTIASTPNHRTDMPNPKPAATANAGLLPANAQMLARLAGLLFLITYATSIPPVVWFYAPALSDPTFVLGNSADGGLTWGALLELVLIAANIATAVVLFPILKRCSEMLALGFLAARIVESLFIAVGILSLLALGTLRQEGTGMDEAALLVVGKALVAVHDWTFLLGPGTVVGIGNGLILGYLMYTSRLVPRAMAVLGLIGGPALLAASVALQFGVIETGSIWQVIATIPEFFWELSLGIWLLVKGFSPAALAAIDQHDENASRVAKA